MNIADLTNPETNPIPEEVQDLVAALIEGRVRSFFCVAELENAEGETEWIEGFEIDMDGHESDDRAFIGAVSMAHVALVQDLLGHEIHVHIGGDDEDDDDADE